MNIENIFDTPSFQVGNAAKKKYLKKEIEFTVSECSVWCFLLSWKNGSSFSITKRTDEQFLHKKLVLSNEFIKAQ